MSEFLSVSVSDELANIIEKLASDQPAGLDICAFVQAHQSVSEDDILRAFKSVRSQGVSFDQHPAVVAFYHEHVADRLAQGKVDAFPNGHPARTFLEENILLHQWLRKAEGLRIAEELSAFAPILERIATVERHYVRKENQLFPLLEKHGWVNPSKFMWAFQDQNRVLIKATQAAVEAGDGTATERAYIEMARELRRMIAVEETRLLPNAMELLSDDEWQEMRRGDDEIGWMLPLSPAPYPTDSARVEPELPSDARSTSAESEVTASMGAVLVNKPPTRRKDLPFPTDDKLYFGEGYMTPEQINLIFRFLPVDITYVDENNRVLFYNRGEDRVFSRSPGIIGREVRFCHPPKSVDTVLRIVEEFRAGTKSVANFWINMRGKIIHIRYFAIRDDQKRYRGVLEMTQDITEMKALEGEQRLLDW